MTMPIHPIPVPPPPAKLPVLVTILPAENIYKTDPTKMYVLSGVYVKFNAFFTGLPPDGGFAIPPAMLFLRAQAHNANSLRVDVCARVISFNEVEHGYGAMILSMGGNPTVQDGYTLDAFGTIPEWKVPSKTGVPIFADKNNVVIVRLEAWVDGQVAGFATIAYTLAPLPQRTT
jgi:hypothetical protein